MKIGIVSDSHGKVRRLAKAIELLRRHGAQAIVHCGDIGSPRCLEVLGRAGVPAYGVAGNMDRHLERLRQEASRCGVHYSDETVLLPLGDNRYLAATHGHREEVIESLLAEGRFAYVCCGHTHKPRNERVGATRIVNPGALHHARPPTVALLDTETDAVEHLRLGRD